VDCTVRDNFCVQVFKKGKGFMAKNLRVCELWENTTLMGGETEPTLSFGGEEINVKKKFRPKFQPLKIRLGFDHARRARGVTGVSGDGVEMKEVALVESDGHTI
jgi:hypothetical protein